MEWVIHFLSDTTAHVGIHNAASDCQNVNIGVPQGSMLGPLISLLFPNDLRNHIDASHLTPFADDHVASAQTPEEPSAGGEGGKSSGNE